MSKEIKEILDILQKCKDYDDEVYLIKQHGATLLLDYITNLQEENKMYAQLKDEYEDIIDKAIKYNYELQERYCHSALFDDLVASKIYEISEKQLNILKGEDK